MLARKKDPEPGLEQRIAAFRSELDEFIMARALEIKQGSDGIPLGNILMMLGGNSGCQCAIAEKIIADRKRDQEIAARQQPAA